jgi:uridylate kinase
MQPKYKRALLKLSGEALSGDGTSNLDFAFISEICKNIKKCHDIGTQMAVVVGGGNIWRGRHGGHMDRTRADHMGMLATAINALAVADILESMQLQVRVLSAITMTQISEPYIRNRAVRHLEKGRVLVCSCGTGNPFFTTDTAAALRAAEVEADVLLKATMVDGVYDKDPHKFSDAKRFDTLTFDDILKQELKVIDSTAASMCKDNKLPMLLFDLSDPKNIFKAVMGEKVGTIVT